MREWEVEGRALPPGYVDRPELPEEFVFYWQAFWDLGTDRPTGMAEGRIPFSAIDRFADRYGIVDLDEFEHFKAIISEIDGEYLRIRNHKEDPNHRQVSMSDVAGIKGILNSLKAKAAADATKE